MITGCDDVVGIDDDGLSGEFMGWLLYGPVTPDDIDAFMGDSNLVDHSPEGGDWDVTYTHVRKVPMRDGGWRYAYTDTPGPGARPCVIVEPGRVTTRWCVNHPYEPWQAAFPIERVVDPPMPKVVDGGYVPLCTACARSFRDRWDAAVTTARNAMRGQG